METQVTIRIPTGLSAKVRQKAKYLGVTRSDVIRLALKDFLEEEEAPLQPYQRVKHLLGSVKTGISDLGENHRKYLIQKIRQKHS